MNDHELSRVQDDLEIMKHVCSEPALPQEEIGAALIIAVFGAAVAAAGWLLPPFWIRLGIILFGLIGTVVYIRWKLRIIKHDAPRRRLDAKELVAWSIVAVGLITYLLSRRFLLTPGEFTPEMVRQEGGAIFCFVGVAILASSTIHRTRRPYIPGAIATMIGGVLFPFATTTALSLTVVGGMMFVGCLGTAIWLSALVRQERREHVGN